MVPLSDLWLPILLSAVLVFVASSVIHMVLRYHWSDFGPVATEDHLLTELRQAGLEPGQYAVPHAATPAVMNSPEYREKLAAGTSALITVLPRGGAAMGRTLAIWFVYTLVVSVAAAYVTGRALDPSAEYLQVFRFATTTAFVAYAFGGWQESIWFGRPWTTTLKATFDALVYAGLTGGVFGWLWG